MKHLYTIRDERAQLHWFTLVLLHEQNYNFLKAQSLLITKW